jgi:hypothetical protein
MTRLKLFRDCKIQTDVFAKAKCNSKTKLTKFCQTTSSEHYFIDPSSSIFIEQSNMNIAYFTPATGFTGGAIIGM